MKNLIDCILKRRSIRKFTDQRVNEQDIYDILAAATAAPSSCDRKTWEFIVVDDEDILSRITNVLGNSEYNPKLAIVVCGNLKLSDCSKCEGVTDECKSLWVQDCSAAMENILLAATALDFGSVWVGVYPFSKNIDAISGLVNAPEDIVPMAIAYIGYKDEIQEARTVYDRTKIHWQRYGNDRF